jgi:hypothetical protein
MDDFQDFIMTLPKQKLTVELKIEILKQAEKMIHIELVKTLRNLSTK